MSDDLFRDERDLRSADGLAIRNATLDYLDLDKVAQHVSDTMRRGRYPENTAAEPVAYLLKRAAARQIGDEIYPTVAGILCFGRDPQASIPDAVVDIGHYRGVEPISNQLFHLEKGVAGTIFEQLQRMEEYLWRNTHHGMALDDNSFQRTELHEYPRAVIRELGVNTLVHRAYDMVGSSVRVLLFRDRIQWDSPGGLPPGVTVQNLLKTQRARNPILVKILFDAGYVEAFGQGLDTVMHALRQEGMEEPIFEDIGTAFIVTVHGRKADAFYNTNLYAHLPESQQRIMNFIRTRSEVAPRDLYELFGKDRTERSIQRDVDKLIDANLLEATGEGRARRFRLYIKPA